MAVIHGAVSRAVHASARRPTPVPDLHRDREHGGEGRYGFTGFFTPVAGTLLLLAGCKSQRCKRVSMHQRMQSARHGGARGAGASAASDESASKGWYFPFILASTAVRSFEAGVVASMMPSIRQGLHLSYTSQGNVAGAPDYGIVPSGLLAMAVFKKFSAYSALTSGYFVIAAVSVLCACHPSLWSLVAARAIGGLCWGLAAVHYPTWVNKYGPAEQRTIWMAGINAMLLAGIVSGYVLGGLARATGWANWQSLYLLEGLLMLCCGVLGSRFDPQVVQVGQAEAEDEGLKGPKTSPGARKSLIPEELKALGRSGHFLCTLAAGCFQSGAVGFMLYFITQALAAIFHWPAKTIYVIVSLVITIGPIGGIVLGASYLSRVGGYQNYRQANGLTAVCAFLSLLCGLCMNFAGGSPLAYGAANMGLLLFGAAPTAAINGIAVSCVPEAKHFASAAQFAAQNLAKLLIPLIGGIVIDHLGLMRGYHLVISGALLLYAAAAGAAYLQAVRLPQGEGKTIVGAVDGGG
ncbi:unnamed protein product [Effrenium voratum]|nr:unnamed protein product [Effrenium voratum]